MKLAVIVAGGKQYIVREGQYLTVEKVWAEEGASVTLPVLAIFSPVGDFKLGTEKNSVNATVTKNYRDKKVDIIKFKNKTRYARKKSHRQPLSVITITSIN